MNHINRLRHLAGLPLLEEKLDSIKADELFGSLEHELEQAAKTLKSKDMASFIKSTEKNFGVDASEELAASVKALEAAHKAVEALYSKILSAE